MPKDDDFNKALNYSFLLLKYRARTEKEIIRRLRLKKFSMPVIEKTVKFLNNYGYIDDVDFTSLFIKEKVNKGMSKKRIYFGLKKLGVSEEIIKEGIADIKRDDYIRGIRKLIAKKTGKYSNIDNKSYKLFHYFVQRGFSPDDIREALNEN